MKQLLLFTVLLSDLIENMQTTSVWFASVSVDDTKDSLMVQDGLADDNGNFKISGITKGAYFLKVYSVGYISLSYQPFSVTDTDANLGALTLKNRYKGSKISNSSCCKTID